ncbi:SDR family oxidoreductase [Myxacorys almedinensis]|uniref:NmrA family NAD(P)-binding protein n=1 Tax=Myxacorys almedinensis A TaxID=2690445 RepID=A0A8J7Z4T0_9CYAN|nr:SDR family oxidoreductase [Myxacorys almedinensis]NDJ19979.1 NmrA family NAD(P)-binding protein [Myxacorys almedinensis A]
MIIITGATGRVGNKLIEALLKAGEPVRVLTRNPQKAANLQASGASVTLGDFTQLSTLNAALSGCNRLMDIPPNTLNQAEQEIQLFEAAKSAGIQHIVKLSTVKANPESNCHFFKQHAIAEEYLKQSGMRFTILQSNSFMQNFLWFTPEIRTQGTLSLPMKGAKTAPVDIRDVVRVAHMVLTRTDGEGNTHNITGLEMLPLKGIAEQLSAAANKKITYINVSLCDFKRTLLQAGLHEWYAAAIVASWQVASEGHPTITNIVAEITGRRPIAFEQFVQDYERSFK